MLMELKHYKMEWPETPVPKDSPRWLYYEVDEVRDDVLRMVEVWESGESQRNSLTREIKSGPPCMSLVGMPFAKSIDGVPFQLISDKEFEALYSAATDQRE